MEWTAKKHIFYFKFLATRALKTNCRETHELTLPPPPKSSLTSIEKLKVVIKISTDEHLVDENVLEKKKKKAEQKKGTLNKIIRAQIGVDFQSRQTWSILSNWLNFIRKCKIKHPAVTTIVFLLLFFTNWTAIGRLSGDKKRCKAGSKQWQQRFSQDAHPTRLHSRSLFVSFSYTHSHTLTRTHSDSCTQTEHTLAY